MSKVVGIDLGTSNSCIAVMDGNMPQVVPSQEEARTTPSVVAFTSNGERLVGQTAKRQVLINPQNTVFGFYRLLGRRFESPEVQASIRFLPYSIVKADNSDAHVQIEDNVYSPTQLCAMVLQKLKAAVENYLREQIEGAVVTVPSDFNAAQRQAIVEAGTLAGLKCYRILNSSTAAALAYGMLQRKVGRVAVYDLGGGTLDVSILELQEGIYRVLSTGGDTHLGGDDFDQRITAWLIEEFQKENEIDLSGDRTALMRLKEAAEKAKCELSSAKQAEIVLPFIAGNQSAPKHLNAILERAKFEQLIEPLLEKTLVPCKQALEDAEIALESIDDVVLVGGQTRTPKVMEVVARLFGREPSRRVNRDEVVAIGAAIQTCILEGEVTDLVLLDVTPHTLGIEAKDGTFVPPIERNAMIPTRKGRLFTTVTDDQTTVDVHVLQGECERAASNTSLGGFRLTGIAPAPKGVSQIEVSCEIDVNGIVQANAIDQASGRQEGFIARAGSGLPPFTNDETGLLPGNVIPRHLTEVEPELTLSDDERAENEPHQLVWQIQGLHESTRKTLDLLPHKLTDEERLEAKRALEVSEQAIAGTVDEQRSVLSRLESTAETLGQAMLRGGMDTDGEERKVSTFERLARMDAAEKMMEALEGDRETRLLLIRDRNRVVFSAVLSSPRLTLGDVEAIARIRNVSPTVLRAIGSKREWTKYYNIRLELVQNPVTPIETSMKLLEDLSEADLGSIAENPQLPGPLRRRAKKLRSKLD